MRDFDFYAEKWGLSAPEKIAETFTSHVFKVQDAEGHLVILKILNEAGVEFEGTGTSYLQYMQGQGCIRILNNDDEALLLEYAEGNELRVLAENGKDKDAAVIAANVIKELHAKQALPYPDEIWAMERNALALLKAEPTLHPLITKAQNIMRHLIDTQKEEDIRMLHRDIHHMNILESKRGWLAIDPQPVIGDRHYECTTFFMNPTGYEKIHDIKRVEMLLDVFTDVLHLDRQRLKEFVFVHAMLSACWSLMDKQDPQSAFAFAQLCADNFF